MTTEAIVESKMIFGPYAEGDCFYIEKSNLYNNVKNGVKMVEFLLLRQEENNTQAIWLIEAKSSAPMPETHSEFIEDIRSKMTNGFLLYLAARLQRYQTAADELPNKFKTPDLKSLEFRFVLVINGHKEAWLPPLNEALSKALNPIVRVWSLPVNSVSVLSHELAQKHGLITGLVP